MSADAGIAGVRTNSEAVMPGHHLVSNGSDSFPTARNGAGVVCDGASREVGARRRHDRRLNLVPISMPALISFTLRRHLPTCQFAQLARRNGVATVVRAVPEAWAVPQPTAVAVAPVCGSKDAASTRATWPRFTEYPRELR